MDYGQLHNIASKAKAELQVNELTVIADRGYYSSEELQNVKRKISSQSHQNRIEGATLKAKDIQSLILNTISKEIVIFVQGESY